jgi:phosphate/sulfate permease
MPPELLISGVGITILVPAIVELAKRSGLPTQYAGLASIVAAGVVLGLVDLREDPSWGAIASWLLLSLVYGLAAAGFYSQVRKLSDRR